MDLAQFSEELIQHKLVNGDWFGPILESQGGKLDSLSIED